MASPKRSTTRILYECGICGAYHPWTWTGDCRDDANRYGGPEDYAAKHGLRDWDIEVRTMDERVYADADDGSALRMELKNGEVYILDLDGQVLQRSDGPQGHSYSGQWRIIGFTRRSNAHQIITLQEVLAGENFGQGWIHDVDHGTRRMWGHPTGRRLARLDRIPASRPI